MDAIQFSSLCSTVASRAYDEAGFFGDIAPFAFLFLVVVAAVRAFSRDSGGATNSSPDPGSIRRPRVANYEIQIGVEESWSGYLGNSSWPDACRALESGESMEVAGFRIENPFVYAAVNKSQRCSEPSAIPIALPASKGVAESLGYWPSYSAMSATQRYNYLAWLAADMPADSVELGYVFIYFYGLERKVLEEQQYGSELVQEILRLRKDYASTSRSFDRYSRGLLLTVLAHRRNALVESDLLALIVGARHLDDKEVNLLLQSAAAATGAISVDVLLAIARHLPDAKRSIVTERAGEHFHNLFRKRATEAWPEGLHLRFGKRATQFDYQPASNSREMSRVEDIPNAMAIRSQFRAIVELWNNCIEDLRKFSGVVRDDEEARDGAAAYASLPDELKGEVTHPLEGEVRTFVGARMKSDVALIEASELAPFASLEYRERLTPTMSRQLVQILEDTGWSVEPDVHLTGRGYRWSERLAVFAAERSEPVRAESYGPASLVVRAGLSIAIADDQVDQGELDLIRSHAAAAFKLNGAEERRLRAFETLLVADGDAGRGLFKRLRDALDLEKREVVAQFLVGVAAADGVVTADEFRALRAAFRAMDIPPTALDELLNETAAGELGVPVVVRRKTDGRKGEAIPPPPSVPEAPIQLDAEKIRLIVSQTEAVQEILAAAMADDEEDALLEEASEVTSGVSEVLSGLDALSIPVREFAKYVLTKSEWPTSVLEAWCKERKLMLGGLIDEINDWAMETHGDLLFEETENGIEVVHQTLEVTE